MPIDFKGEYAGKGLQVAAEGCLAWRRLPENVADIYIYHPVINVAMFVGPDTHGETNSGKLQE